MTTERFNKVINEQVDYCLGLLVKKSEEYTTTVDRLSNFKKAAALEGKTPKQALLGMLAKHIVSVYDLSDTSKYDPLMWREKITDSINYFLLLTAVLEEEYGGQD